MSAMSKKEGEGRVSQDVKWINTMVSRACFFDTMLRCAERPVTRFRTCYDLWMSSS